MQQWGIEVEIEHKFHPQTRDLRLTKSSLRVRLLTLGIDLERETESKEEIFYLHSMKRPNNSPKFVYSILSLITNREWFMSYLQSLIILKRRNPSRGIEVNKDNCGGHQQYVLTADELHKIIS